MGEAENRPVYARTAHLLSGLCHICRPKTSLPTPTQLKYGCFVWQATPLGGFKKGTKPKFIFVGLIA